MMSMITPPVAIAAYAGAAIAKTDPIKTCLSAIRFGWPAYVVPFLFVLSPNLLMKGENADIIWAVVTAVGGVWMLTIAVIGYFSKVLDIGSRLVFALAGFALLIPAGVVPGGVWVDLGGGVLAAAIVFYLLVQARRNVVS